MEYEKCYAFEPEDAPPRKRRRTEPQGLHTSWPHRRKAYQDAWQQQRLRISATLSKINATVVEETTVFLDDALYDGLRTRIPAGIIVSGPSRSLQTTLVQQLAISVNKRTKRLFVSLDSTAGSNFKALLKALIQRATSSTDGVDEDEDDEDEDDATLRRGARLLNYDLQILYDYVRERRVKQVVIAFQDTEAFNSDLLSDILELMHCWQDRIPFVCLLNVATSLDFLQQRLSRAAVRAVEGRLFDAAPSSDELEQVLDAALTTDAEIWIGPNVIRSALERQVDYIQSVDSFVDAIQYAYMSCYYANPLSLFLDLKLKLNDIPEDHLEAVRSLDTFKSACGRLLDNGEYDYVEELLDLDKALLDWIKPRVEQGRLILADMVAALEVVRCIQQQLPDTSVSAKSHLYVQAMSGKLAGSVLIRTMLMSVRKAPSDIAIKLMDAVSRLEVAEDVQLKCIELAEELENMVRAQSDPKRPLRSEDDVRNSTMRTTMVSQKVELSKQKSALSKQDAAYSKILRRFTDLLETYFKETLRDPKSIALHEIFFYDLASPHREVFTPRPRHAVERALATPHDYLACSCCAPSQAENDEATLSASQPATAVLYQLYLESGSLINVSDLWQAFQAVMGDERPQEQIMALFQRAMAELRYLGLVKSTRKKADHVAKVAWRGL